MLLCKSIDQSAPSHVMSVSPFVACEALKLGLNPKFEHLNFRDCHLAELSA